MATQNDFPGSQLFHIYTFSSRQIMGLAWLGGPPDKTGFWFDFTTRWLKTTPSSAVQIVTILLCWLNLVGLIKSGLLQLHISNKETNCLCLFYKTSSCLVCLNKLSNSLENFCWTQQTPSNSKSQMSFISSEGRTKLLENVIPAAATG